MLYIYIVIVQLYTKNVPTANTKQENLSDFCFFDTVDASLWAKVATPALILSYARFLEDCDHGKSHETSAFKGGLIVSYCDCWIIWSGWFCHEIVGDICQMQPMSFPLSLLNPITFAHKIDWGEPPRPSACEDRKYFEDAFKVYERGIKVPFSAWSLVRLCLLKRCIPPEKHMCFLNKKRGD